MGVLLNSQTVGANVGVQSPEANELQREGKKNSDDQRWAALRVLQTIASPPPNEVLVRVYL
jgi:hypothetical protein